MSWSQKIGGDFAAVGILNAIWTSAYGAAYVTDFKRTQEVLGSFDSAMNTVSAETAETIADQAVAEWLRWNMEGKWPRLKPRAPPRRPKKKAPAPRAAQKRKTR